MYQLSRTGLLGFAIALMLASGPTYADDLPQYLGPVGPNAPILTTVGGKRVLAFYEAEGGNCGMHIIVGDLADVSGGSAVRVRTALEPRQVVHIDTPENRSLNLQCGQSADTLAVVDDNNAIASVGR
ncbi:MAG: hypothetical protein R3245_09340 [Kiloniellales bacterium]|nr:hypothetical protein [Kiloniellales bacterium]